MIIFKEKFMHTLVLASIMVASVSTIAFAQDIRDETLRIGKSEFFVDEVIEMVFDKDADYRQLFNCNTILMETKNDDGGITAACVTSGNVLWIHTKLTTKNQVRSAYVCPGNQSQSSVDRLVELSFDMKPLSNGETYLLGYTDGWRRDYVHRLPILTIDGEVLACWDVARR